MKGNDRFDPVRTLGLCLLAATLALTACSGGADGTPSTSVPATVSTTSTTVAPDVSTVPEVIDEAYVNAVLAALDEVDGEATRIIKDTRRFPPDAADLLNTIYADKEFDNQANNWLQALVRDRELKNVRPDPGSRVTRVERIIFASPRCLWFAMRRDYSAVYFELGPDRVQYLALEPLDRSNDPKGHNPTPWMITAEGYREDGVEPGNPCASS